MSRRKKFAGLELAPFFRGGSALRERGPGAVRILEWRCLVAKFLLWLILLVLCWPLALLGLVLYPLVWLLLLPFRLLGIGEGRRLRWRATGQIEAIEDRLGDVGRLHYTRFL